MIQQQTILKVADNTGAKELMCTSFLRGFGELAVVVSEAFRAGSLSSNY